MHPKSSYFVKIEVTDISSGTDIFPGTRSDLGDDRKASYRQITEVFESVSRLF